MKAFTKETQADITPQKALDRLLEGNKRFVSGNLEKQDYLDQVKDTATGQFPFAAVLSCIDSRVPVEVVFDHGIGHLFSARVAGNIVDEDMLGSIEYSCKVAGSKLVLVLGHTACGAVKGACDDVQLGNITALLSKIKPAVKATKTGDGEARDSSNITFVNDVVKNNVVMTIQNIRKESPVLKDMEEDGSIIIKGAVYDIATGKVNVVH
ncbi:carbonic anhydrase family protein [Gangjinia marincola]|uniref:Carbonic anhydrase family protein n=1 Tax=Gangjinia marincola TaxID=578463 RepID=A0ABN1MHN2_9FLAO